MPKIRTIKPEFWTDDAMVTVSFASRLLFIGLWTFCDDDGMFEWKPLTLKMKIFPNDQVAVGDLLGELQEAGVVDTFRHNDVQYGVVINFSKHQKVDSRFRKTICADLTTAYRHYVESRRDSPSLGIGGGGGVGSGGVVVNNEKHNVSDTEKLVKPSAKRKGPHPAVDAIMQAMEDCYGKLDGPDRDNRFAAWNLYRKVAAKAREMKPAATDEECMSAAKALIFQASRHEFWSGIRKVSAISNNVEKIVNDLRKSSATTSIPTV